MPTIITHPVVALALAPCFGCRRIAPAVVALGAAFTVVPDLDVIGLRLGIPYGSLFGHRGFSHSLFFAALLAGLALLAVDRRASRARSEVSVGAVFLFLFVCAASHGLLDALTDGGHGVAFLAPFSAQRFFFPWRPLRVSPLSLSGFLSGRGWPVLLSELRWLLIPALLLGGSAWFARRSWRPGRADRAGS